MRTAPTSIITTSAITQIAYPQPDNHIYFITKQGGDFIGQ